jgi:hypothetical protein
MQQVIFKDLGLIDYKESSDYQENLFNYIVKNNGCKVLLAFI